jgi:hypothetical protein
MWDPSAVGNTMYSAGIQLAFIGKLKNKNPEDGHRRTFWRRGVSGHVRVYNCCHVFFFLPDLVFVADNFYFFDD